MSKIQKSSLVNCYKCFYSPLAELRFCAHKSSACQEKKTDFRGAQSKGSLREGAPDEVGWGRARCDIISANPKSRGLLPSRFACHLPPGGRLCCRRQYTKKGVTHYTLQSKACEKRTENFHVLCPFVVGAIHESPVWFFKHFWRATTGRPYKFVFYGR